MQRPAPEVEVDEDLVRRLLVEQHPDLAGLALTYVDAGFDNALWRLGDVLAVRLPVRAVAVPLVAHEQRWLPQLAPRLPLPVPAPVRTGAPSAGYPWSWSVVPWLPGVPADQAPVTDGPRSGAVLGRFLRALHVPAPADAPANPWRGVALAERSATAEERMAQLVDRFDMAAVREVWRQALAAPPHDGPPLWLHGDLHGGNLLVRRGTPVAVIDFGDMCGGDPATDIAAAFMVLPSEGWSSFVDAYGPVEGALLDRARGWALLFGLMLTSIGLAGTPATYLAMGEHTVARVLAGSTP